MDNKEIPVNNIVKFNAPYAYGSTAEKLEPEKQPSRSTCWLCGGELLWNSDFNYDEVYDEGEGIVSFLTCMECGAEVQVSLRTDNEEDQEETNGE